MQENLGILLCEKINADTWGEAFAESRSQEDLSTEAILPAVLTALCKYSRTAKGAETILLANLNTDWTALIFGDSKKQIIKTIAEYSHDTTEDAIIKIRIVTKEAIRVIRKQVTINGSINDIRNTLTDSLDDALFSLPIHMQIGKLLSGTVHANSIPKNEGPTSNLVYTTDRSISKIKVNEIGPSRRLI